MRDFDKWLKTLKSNIASFDFYADFPKVYANASKNKDELELINSVVGSKNIKQDITKLIKKNPKILAVVPSLLAKRESRILVNVDSKEEIYDFENLNHTIQEYIDFMEKSKLLDLIQNHIVNSVTDYIIGLEVGMDTNARKNRSGKAMEKIVENHLEGLGLIKNKTYWSQMRASTIKTKFGIDVTGLDKEYKAEKVFDFVIYLHKHVYAIETNFYSGGGSKLNETARSYKNIVLESKKINNFTFVWITDGQGWLSAKNNLRETFEIHENLFNLNDLKNGKLKKLIK